jgi:hypothetical protein
MFQIPKRDTGWWLTYPSEKYSMGRIIPYIMENKNMKPPITNQVIRPITTWMNILK